MKILLIYLHTMLLGTMGPFPDAETCLQKKYEQEARVAALRYPFKMPDDKYYIECHDAEGALPLKR